MANFARAVAESVEAYAARILDPDPRVVALRRRNDNLPDEIEAALKKLDQRIETGKLSLRERPHDNNARRGLIKASSQRRRLLDYLKIRDPRRYQVLVDQQAAAEQGAGD